MRIALLGSASSSLHLAPFSDSSWEIWACSPAVASLDPKFSVWFELHPFKPGAPNMAQWYVDWMSRLDVPVYMQRADSLIPTSKRYPFRAMIKLHGRYFFTSSIAWMFALAMKQDGVDEIGMWGIDLAAATEYERQKMGLLHFVHTARQMGIKVTAPPESCVLQPPPLYGLWESTPMGAKLKARREELEETLAAERAKAESVMGKVKGLEGAIHDLDYIQRTWMQDERYIDDDNEDSADR